MLSEKMQEALNEQIGAELTSSYLYLAMAAYCDDQDLAGFAHWMRAQAKEEVDHAMRIYDYVNGRNGRVVLAALPAPQRDWASPLAAFEAVLEHEREVTQRINRLVDQSAAEGDHATHAFLQWFVTEQVEEEATAYQIIQKIKLVAQAPAGLYWIDRELASRA